MKNVEIYTGPRCIFCNWAKELLDPNKKETYDSYGNILLKLNLHDEALDYIRKGTGFIRFTQKNFKVI